MLSRFSISSLGPKQTFTLLLGILLLAAGLSLGSYRLPEKALTARRGPLALIPRSTRQTFVLYRGPIGAGSAGLFILIAAGWMGTEGLARAWQKRRNEELAANAVLLRLAPRVDDKSQWAAAADLWAALHSTLARPGWQSWLGAGLHVSFEIVQQAGERLTFYLWAPRPVAETLVRQFRAVYAGLEIETLIKSGPEGGPSDEMNDYLLPAGEALSWQWADLGLARESWRPLRANFSGDPLPSLLSSLEGLAPGSQLAALHFVLRPAADGWQRGGQAFAARLRGDTRGPGQPRPRLGSQERELLKQIEAKGQARGYDLCLRALVAGVGDVSSNPSSELRINLDRLIRVFDQFGADNRLAVRQNGDEKELYRLRGRYFPAGWGPSVVSEAELAALAHLPNADISGVSIARARARIEKPSPVSFIQPGEKRVALGRFVDVPSFGGGLAERLYPLQSLRRLLKLSGGEISPTPGPLAEAERAVGIKLIDARRHFHVVGPTGVGKSTMLLRMIWQYLADFPEAAVWLQEPHQDLTHKVVKRVPLWREKDVIWLDVMDPLRVLGINPLELPAGAEMGAVVANVMGIMRKAMGANWDSAVQMQEILENALLAVLAGQPRPTMVHLLKLLTNTDYRYDLTVNLNDPIAAPYWQSLEQKKEKELDAIFSVPRRRINAFVRNAVVRRIVAQPDSTVNFRQAIDSGKIILVQLDERMGGSNRAFIGAMMMYKLFGAIMSRMDIEEGERRQVAICVDEFQTFVGQSGPEFANILEQARKMGASLTLAHQHLGQLAEGDLVRSVANNTGTKIVFRAEASDAPQFLKWLPELKAIEDLTTLANYRCYVRPMVNGSPQPVCTLYTYADPPIPDPEAELRSSRRGEPEPLPPHPGNTALAELKRVQGLASDEERRAALRALPERDWPAYMAARRYDDAVRRNELIEHPEKLPDKLARVRELVRLGYGTPHYETEALVDAILR
ncbi:MAG: type IV secretion system DNA-binding domain-containing protein [Anaerolineae bacterium]|nr:type IV secretion system DNA-binding domain-containing protein [Anaerolineae bacterium]